MIKLPKLTIAHAIIIAGVLIALAIIFTTGPVANAPTEPGPTGDLTAVEKVSTIDHILGNPNAPITIIEYSDLDCPFCQRFHTTMEQIVAEYPNDVRWVYRHFPLESLHPMAFDEASVAECVAKHAGNDAFWKALPVLLDINSSQFGRVEVDTVGNQLAPLGVTKAQIQNCLESGQFDEKISSQSNNAVETGGTGTPWSIIMGPNKKDIQSINGAQPYSVVKAIVDEMLD